MPNTSFIQIADHELGTSVDLNRHCNRLIADCSNAELPKLFEATHRARLLAGADPKTVEAIFANAAKQLANRA